MVYCSWRSCTSYTRSGRSFAGWRRRPLFILVVTKGYGIARLRLVTCAVLVVLVFFLYGVGPFFSIPAVGASKRAIHLLDRSYSARPLADKLATIAPASESIAVFRVRRDVEYGLSFYRNREVVNYEQDGVPDEEHLLVARVTGRGGADLDTPATLVEYLQGRQYQQIFIGLNRASQFTALVHSRAHSAYRSNWVKQASSCGWLQLVSKCPEGSLGLRGAAKTSFAKSQTLG